MDIIFYDLEVFKYDWTVTFKSLRTGEYWFYHNDNNSVRKFMQQENIMYIVTGKQIGRASCRERV